MSLATGTKLGSYEILAPLGAGGMGEVYRARDTKLGREVAIKVLPSSFASDPDRLARFEREARLLASLNHPNIGAIYGVEESGGVVALVLELVDGETLADRIGKGSRLRAAGASARQAGLEMGEALAIARQIADALDAAHERGIVHRDLKPANIVLTPDGTVKVLDFGLAKEGTGSAGPAGSDLSHSPTLIGPTLDGVLLGTAPYMSPEQARGKSVDKRTDIWAFGCVLFEMLTGRRAFSGETTSDTIAAILEREPDWTQFPAPTPPHVLRLVRRCLDKDPKRRLRDIGDARVELDGALAPGAETERQSDRPSWWAWAVAAILVAVASSVATSLVLRMNGMRAASKAPPSMAATIASRLTNYGGNESDAVLAPDGRSFVFVSDHNGTPDIWLRQVSGGDPVRLTNDEALETNLAYTPDGEAIYFARIEGNGASIWRMGALGGQQQRVLSAVPTDGTIISTNVTPQVFSLSPDGRRMAFHARGALTVSDVDGAGGRTLAENVLTSAGRPAWSPDGRRLAFVRGGLFAPGNLFVVDTATGRERQVTHFTRSIEGVSSQAWLPDGQHLVVSYVPSSRQQAPGDLGILDSDDGSIVRLTLAVSDGLSNPSVSADGSRLIVSASHYEREVWKVPLGSDPDANGRAAIRLMDAARDPMWTFVTRDGRTLLFNSPTSGSRNLWTWELSGRSAPRQITAIANDVIGHSSLSPDGSRVAFVSNATGNSDIWTQSVDGSNLRPLTSDAPADSWPVWSPDGRWVAYSSLRGAQETWRVLADGSAPPEKVIDGFFRGDWATAADGGTRIVTSDGGTNVRLIDVERRAVVWTTRVWSSGGTLSMPQFSPDGRRVSVPLPAGPGRDAIWILDASTGEGRIAVRFSRPMQVFFRASWADNGSALIVNGYRLQRHIELFDRFWQRAVDRR